MERLIILLGRPNNSITPTNYFFKVPLVGRFIPLIGGIGQLVESPLKSDFFLSLHSQLQLFMEERPKKKNVNVPPYYFLVSNHAYLYFI